MNRLTAVLALSLAVLGCTAGSPPPTSSPSPPPSASPLPLPSPPPSASLPPSASTTVDDRQFLSTSVTEDGAERPLVAGTRIRIHFTAGNVTLSAGCNIIGGRYAIEGGRLVTDAMSMTEMGCDPPRSAQDEWLAAFIGSRPTVQLNGNELILEANDTIIDLLDREIAEPDLALVGPTWTLTSIIAGDAVSSVPDQVVARLQFAEDGQLQLAPGCNQGTGRWTVEEGILRVTDVGLTRMACMGAAGQVEEAVLSVLQAEQITVEIEAGMLTLSAGEIGLQLTGS